jgi:hypothetical protein
MKPFKMWDFYKPKPIHSAERILHEREFTKYRLPPHHYHLHSTELKLYLQNEKKNTAARNVSSVSLAALKETMLKIRVK